MTLLSVGRRPRLRGSRLVTLVTVVVIGLLSASAAHAATPSLLSGEKIDEDNASVSCASASYCVASGLDLIVQDHAVRTDLSNQLLGESGELTAVACVPGSTSCALLDDNGGAYTLTGTTVSSRTSVDGITKFDAVSCPVTGFCMAIDELGNTFTLAGTQWTSAGPKLGTLSSGLSRLQVSCISQSRCFAAVPVGGASSDEDYYIWNGVSWTSQGPMDSDGAAVSGLSCTSTSFCVATDTQDNALVYTGTWASSGSSITGEGALSDGLYVSCAPGTTFCLAASEETGATLTTINGSDWTQGTNIKQLSSDGSGAGGPTSCASTTLCAIVDSEGTAYTYALPDTAPAPTLAGAATVGSTLTVTPGAVASPDASAVSTLQRCLGGCTALPGGSYVTTAADVDADFMAVETTGVGLDIEGPVNSNTVGPIVAARDGAPGPSPGPSPGPGTGGGKPLHAKLGSPTPSGTEATLRVSCPAASSRSCHVALTLTIIEKVKNKKHRTVTLGSAAATVKAGAQRKVTVSLNGAGKRLLTARHRLLVQLTVTQGGKTLTSKSVHFTAPHNKHHKKKHHKK